MNQCGVGMSQVSEHLYMWNMVEGGQSGMRQGWISGKGAGSSSWSVSTLQHFLAFLLPLWYFSCSGLGLNWAVE